MIHPRAVIPGAYTEAAGPGPRDAAAFFFVCLSMCAIDFLDCEVDSGKHRYSGARSGIRGGSRS